MQHLDMVRYFQGIIPQLAGQPDPGSVLVKCARDKNFSGAQLEKLAHIFNTAKAITIMEKSAHRADYFDILDVPGLVASYETFAPEAKQASTHTAFVGNPFDVPNLLRRGEEKQASVSLSSVSSAEGEYYRPAMKAAAERWQSDQRLLDDAEQVRVEVVDEYKACISEMTGLLDDQGFDSFAKVAAEVELRFGETGAKVMSDLESFCERNRGISVKRASASLPATRFAKDPGGWFDLVERATTLRAVYKSAAHTIGLVKEASSAGTADKKKQNRPRGAEDNNLAGGSKGKTKRPTAAEADDLAWDLAHGAQGQALSAEDDTEAFQDYAGANDTVKSVLDGILDLNKQTAGKLDSTAKSLTSGDFARSMGQAFGGGGSDKARQKLDADLADDDATVALVDLMGDDIIGAYPPEEVSQMFNSLRQANPQIAKDKMLLKLAIRESLQYGSIPLHLYKEMLDMNKTQQDIELKSTANSSARYAVGGGAPPRQPKPTE